MALNGSEVGAPTSLVTKVATEVGGVWHAHVVSYSVASVRLDGGQAVFAGRQWFVPASSNVWTVALSVFDVTVTAHDILFGSRVTTRAVITRPDGTHDPVRLGGGSPNELTSMVRGLCDLDVDAAVLGGHTKVLVSRDDSVDLRVITLLDALVIAVLTLVLVVLVVLGGRLMARRRQRGSPQ